jgi:hypothetical protein
MRVHAFLATADELPGLLDAGAPPAPGSLLTGVDPLNLASLVEIVTGRSIDAENASAALETPVLGAGPRGPFIHRLPVEAVDALGNAEPSERARWATEWTGGAGGSNGGPEKAVEALSELAAARGPEQQLYLWVADGP